MMKPVILKGGKQVNPSTVARAAGYTFEKVDKFLGSLGRPVGIMSYRPHHSTGEDYLHNYLGMIGIPINLRPEFPADPGMIILTESAKKDPDIVKKIKNRLIAGYDVTITSGLLNALQGKGIEDIVELEYTGKKALVTDFAAGWRSKGNKSEKEILIPQINYLTNDSWADMEALGSATGWPLLHQARFGNASLFVLTIPDSFGDLYELPEGVLNRLRDVLSSGMNVRIEGPAKVSLFIYDNNTFIVESFLPETSKVRIVTGTSGKLTDIVSGVQETSDRKAASMIWGRKPGEKLYFDIELKPHSFRVFRMD